MSEQLKPCPFHIDTKPISISFECPHCEHEVTVRWANVDVPECWGDDWGEIECPDCKETVRLGDFEYD